MTEAITPGEQDVLLVVDVQNDFCPGGALAVERGDEVVPVINRLARAFRHVVMTQDWHPGDHKSFASAHPGKRHFESVRMPYGEQTLWPDHCVQQTPGAAFHEDLDLPNCQLIIRKGFRPDIDSYSAFYENDRATPTGLAGYLTNRGFRRIFVVGLATDYCVHYSAVDARKEGFETFVIEDACRAIDLEGSLAAAMRNMKDNGVIFLQSSDVVAAR